MDIFFKNDGSYGQSAVGFQSLWTTHQLDLYEKLTPTW
jgi:hypothetical protein